MWFGSQALGLSFFASTKVVKIDPELSMLVKHLIANSFAEFKIRLLSAKVSRLLPSMASLPPLLFFALQQSHFNERAIAAPLTLYIGQIVREQAGRCRWS